MDRMVDDEFNGGDEAMSGHPADPARVRARKTADAFRTISEVADELHVPQHVLRFWETKFPQVRPLKRGGGRRYYRPEDVLLLRRVADLLYTQGYTIKGVQRLLREGGGALHENIPPASPEERMAAEAEWHIGPAPDSEAARSAVAPHIIPQLPLPDFVPISTPVPKYEAESAAPPPESVEPDAEAERLRALLTETLEALEDLRRFIG